MPNQIGYFDTLKSVTGKVFTYLASITLTGTDGKTITCTQDTSLDEAVAMSSKAPKTDVIKGDGTAGRVIRQSRIIIQDGTAANSLKITMASWWNGDAFAAVDDILKDDSYYGNVKLGLGGGLITIRAAGLSGNCIAALAVFSDHDSALTWKNLTVGAASNNLTVGFNNGFAWVDLTAIAAGKFIYVYITYVTSA